LTPEENPILHCEALEEREKEFDDHHQISPHHIDAI